MKSHQPEISGVPGLLWGMGCSAGLDTVGELELVLEAVSLGFRGFPGLQLR